MRSRAAYKIRFCARICNSRDLGGFGFSGRTTAVAAVGVGMWEPAFCAGFQAPRAGPSRLVHGGSGAETGSMQLSSRGDADRVRWHSVWYHKHRAFSFFIADSVPPCGARRSRGKAGASENLRQGAILGRMRPSMSSRRSPAGVSCCSLVRLISAFTAARALLIASALVLRISAGRVQRGRPTAEALRPGVDAPIRSQQPGESGEER